jgi:hypothetical protein
MNIPEPYNKVIYGLLEKSKANGVVWNTTTDSGTFVVYFNKFSLSIRQHGGDSFNNDNPETWITVDLINNEGERIDGFSTEENDADWGKVNELYTLARRSALSIDDAIQEMLTELNKNSVVGQKKKEDNNPSNKDGFIDDIPF